MKVARQFEQTLKKLKNPKHTHTHTHTHTQNLNENLKQNPLYLPSLDRRSL